MKRLIAFVAVMIAAVIALSTPALNTPIAPTTTILRQGQLRQSATPLRTRTGLLRRWKPSA